jgi:hypothetical protein
MRIGQRAEALDAERELAARRGQMVGKERTIELSRGSVLILTDWAANSEWIAAGREAMLWELIVHCLLSDRVLVQDESLAQSQKLAKWFANREAQDLLRELFDIGAFGVLVQDPRTYPDELRDIAEGAPISTRARYIHENTSKAGVPFKATSQQAGFHAVVDQTLRDGRSRAQIRRTSGVVDLHTLFQERLLFALQDDATAKWVGSGRLDARVREEVATYVRDPLKAAARIRTQKMPAQQLDPRFEEDPRFTRTLGHYLARTYLAKGTRAAIDAMVHSAFAAALCEIEGGAAGRYSPVLRELLPRIERAGSRAAPGVRVIRRVTIPLNLPPLQRGFAKVIAEVRESDAGKRLRESMRHPEAEPTFDRQLDSWNAVAAEVARRISRARVKPITVVLTEANTAAFESLLASFLVGVLRTATGPIGGHELADVTAEGIVAGVAAGGLIGVSQHLHGLVRASVAEEQLSRRLEQALEIRCTPIRSWKSRLPD